MTIFNLYISFLKARRAVQIVNILLKHAFANFFSFAHYTIINRTLVQNKVHSTPERMRMLIEELGPTYVKFGQIVADRPDVVSERFRVELKKLQNNVEPFDSNVAIVLIEKEMGKLIGEVFAEFETIPLASASIGQVYCAVLKNGCPVVVKIQRPNIENKIKLDIYLMKYLARYFARQYPELTALNIVGLVDDFSESIIEELDFTMEAGNTEMFHKMFAEDPTVKIPYVWNEYTTRRLIVMERIIGITPESHDELVKAGLDPKTVIHNGANAIFKMILKHGIFHADPHPGNLFILKDNVIAFIDFGIISVMRPSEIDFIADYSIGFSKKDSVLITKALIKLCGSRFFDKEAEVQYDIKRMLIRNITDEALDIKNFSHTLHSSIDIIVKYNMQMPSGVFMLLKTLLTLEKFSMRLDSNIDLASVILPYSKEIAKSRYSSRRLASDIYDTACSYLNLVRELPENISEILYKFKEGKIKHDIKLEDEGLFTNTFRQMTLRISYVLLLIGLFIGSSILVVLDYETKFGVYLMYGTSGMIFLLLIQWLFRKRR